MKVMAKLDGHDGIRGYSAGDVLDYDTQHVRMLLQNNLAEPLDAQATRIHEEMENSSEEDWQAHPLSSESHWDRGEEIARVEAEREQQARDMHNETDENAEPSVDMPKQRAGAPPLVK